MASNLIEEAILEAAIAGVSRVAEAIAAVPDESRDKALEAAERSYFNAALDLGYGEAQAQGWAAAIVDRLRAELAERQSRT
jgi:hypothetical protein